MKPLFAILAFFTLSAVSAKTFAYNPDYDYDGPFDNGERYYCDKSKYPPYEYTLFHYRIGNQAATAVIGGYPSRESCEEDAAARNRR